MSLLRLARLKGKKGARRRGERRGDLWFSSTFQINLYPTVVTKVCTSFCLVLSGVRVKLNLFVSIPNVILLIFLSLLGIWSTIFDFHALHAFLVLLLDPHFCVCVWVLFIFVGRVSGRGVRVGRGFD